MDSTFPSDIRSRPKTSRMHGMTWMVMLKMVVPKAVIEVVVFDVEWMGMDEPKPLVIVPVMQMLATCFVFFKVMMFFKPPLEV